MSLSLSSVHSAQSCVSTKPVRPSLPLFLQVWSERRALSRMDESRLNDLGITAADASKEARRAIWDLPRVRC